MVAGLLLICFINPYNAEIGAGRGIMVAGCLLLICFINPYNAEIGAGRGIIVADWPLVNMFY